MNTWKSQLCRDVTAKPVEWLWPRYLARGKLALLDGDPEMGKSLVTLDLMARLSREAPLPDGSPPRPRCTSILLSTEDDAADTIRPRAEAARADLARLVLPDFADHMPSFPADLGLLEDMIRAHAAALVAIDPLMAFLPLKVAANLDQSIRRMLTPLADLAARTHCAVLLVRHLTKRPTRRAIHRGQGSMGILAAVRTSLFVAADPKDPDVKVLTLAKTNMGERPPGLRFRIVEQEKQPVIQWIGDANLTADELCAEQPDESVRPRERAAAWLKAELAFGPRLAAELYAKAAENGIPERTLERAKKVISVHSHRTWDVKQNRGEWYWFDPDAPWPKQAPFKKPYELPPLPPL